MRDTYISDIQRYSIHDGEGIRTTVFFKGCPLSCAWCHNPETQQYEREPFFYRERCTGCTECSKDCPQGAIRMEKQEGEKYLAFTDRNLCERCGECLDSCGNNAREICGRVYSVKELLEELIKDMPFYETSHGGVTLSGGEVLSQNLSVVVSLMQELTSRGISVNIDTCGQVGYEAFTQVLPYTNVFLYDMKLMDSRLHKQYTGVGNELILSNLKHLAADGGRIWIRIPVIGGVNDTEQNMEQTADFLCENRICPEHIHLLPYHNTGSGKYGRLSREYPYSFEVPSAERMEQFRQIFEQKGFSNVYIGG